MAQDAVSAEEVGSTDIVVTARNRAENLQDVPLSIRAFGAEELERRNVRSLQEVASLTPGLTFNEFKVGSIAVPTIRGLAQTDVTSLSNNVPVFLDGVYLGAKAGLNISQLNLERIEVLKGPQSARYGRGAFAGAINYVSKEPGSTFDGSASLSAGSDSYYSARVSVAGPLSDTISARLAVGYDTFDGTYKNQFQPYAELPPIPGAKKGVSNIGGYENKTINGAIVFRPTTSLKLRAMAYYNEGHRDPGAWRFYPNNCGNNYNATTYRYRCGELPKLGRNDLSLDTRAPGIDTKTFFGSFLADYEFDSGVKISLLNGYNSFRMTGYEPNERLQPGEISVNNPVLGTDGRRYQIEIFRSPISAPREVNEWSSELRIASPSENALRVEGGGFYAKSKYHTETVMYLDLSRMPAGVGLNAPISAFVTSAVPGTDGKFAYSQLSDDQLSQRSLFAGAQYDVTDKLTLGVEGRYTWETVASQPKVNTTPVTDPRLLDVSKTFGYFTPRITADYKLSSDSLLFASVAKGVKAGGFNSRGTDEELTFRPESNWTYELGVKSSWFNRRLTANASFFYTDWKDLQFATPSRLPTPGINITSNITGAKAKGFELEMSARPARWLSLGGSYSYTDSRYNDGTSDPGQATACAGSGTCSIDVSNNRLPRYSPHQASVFGEVRAPVGGFSGYVTTSYTYRSRQFSDTLNARWVGEREIVNVKAGLQSSRWDLSIWVDNLTNEKDPLADTFAPRTSVFLFLSQPVYGELRRFGTTAIFKF